MTACESKGTTSGMYCMHTHKYFVQTIVDGHHVWVFE
jgi:hypothetical protein